MESRETLWQKFQRLQLQPVGAAEQQGGSAPVVP
jgi:hypothetical protein